MVTMENTSNQWSRVFRKYIMTKRKTFPLKQNLACANGVFMERLNCNIVTVRYAINNMLAILFVITSKN